MSSFFTRGGDDGYTGLLGEGRVAKYDDVLEALGALDEATATLGLARAICQAEEIPDLILQIQRHLYALMAELAATPENTSRFHTISAAQVDWLEGQTAIIGAKTPPLKEFIVPGDTYAGAQLDLARTVIRRAERRVAALLHSGRIGNADLLHYLNRLSSLVFVMEIYENQVGGQARPTLAKTERA